MKESFLVVYEQFNGLVENAELFFRISSVIWTLTNRITVVESFNTLSVYYHEESQPFVRELFLWLYSDILSRLKYLR